MFLRRYVAKIVIISISVTAFLILKPGQTSTTVQTGVDWCQEHRVPESVCTMCNTELRESFKSNNDWCRGCDLPESHCYVCNPEIKFPQELEYINWVASFTDKESTQAPDWCDDHRVPESECTKCNIKLIDSFKAKKDWCAGHGLPESHCYVCNPGIKFPQESEYNNIKSTTTVDWCDEHRVPESECTKCNTKLIDSFKGKKDWCAGHDLPESHCYICNPGIKFPQEMQFEQLNGESTIQREGKPQTSIFRSNKKFCTTNDAVIQLASVQSGQRVGLEFATVVEIITTDHVEAPGEIRFSPSSATIVPSLVRGTLVRWVASPGQQLTKNQIIANIESIEAASLCSDYLQSKAILNLNESNLLRKKDLAKIGLISEREVLDAETEVEKSRIYLRKTRSALVLIGYSEEDIANAGKSDFINTLIYVRAPQSGKLIDYRAELGSIIEVGQPLAQVADVNEIEVIVQIRESDIPRVRIGQTASISSDGNALQRESGEVIWVSDVANPVTRSVPVRIRVLQNDSDIRFQQYVRVSIEVEKPQSSVMIPESAVQWDGCCNVVFIAETPDRLRPRKITIEYASHGGYVVTGIEPGPRIATSGSYLLKTEMMKEGIGAGCCPVGV
ncbi:MAG: efflux RND transporter periplasmic adaptor subunit [Calditrichaeota bacterium]|nr:efflux RND transporter periplasmic adaptor subunit [Calditrichota bacterium]